jgi:signal transduction histidine kinase/predicted CoA-binding protein
MHENFEFLRKVPLFADLPDRDLEQVCQMAEEVRLKEGDVLFTEGSLGDRAYVIKEGQIEIFKNSGGRNVQLAIRQSGEVIGEMSLLESTPRSASGRALTESVLIAIGQAEFDKLLDVNPKAVRTMLHTVTARLRSTEILLNQSDKMAQLGTLTAGIAHELNNPAAAAKRGAEQLREAIGRLQDLHVKMSAKGFSPVEFATLTDLGIQARQAAEHPVALNSLDRSDRESELEDWLDDQGIDNGWELAPVLVNLGYTADQLDGLAGSFPPECIPIVVDWLGATYTSYSLLNEISQGSSRISEIVKALKSYVYLDQAPVQEVDVQEGIENTLVILRHKLKQGVEIHREYDPNLPHIQAHGSELNQVWTNIIDNAVDAMEGKGKLTIRTQYQEPWVVVNIGDTGPGIPPEVQKKLFSPFFTTKPLGKGTGLGLNISYNIVHKHGGDIRVYSQPGDTHFEAWLPVNFEAMQKAGQSLARVHHQDEGAIRHILESVHTIAVVGISEKQDSPRYSVPAYLQQHGYRIIPVNPNLTEVLGEKAYADLLAIPEPVDLVQIFRASEHVPSIAEQAIQIGAKYIWMQEGVVNEAAAQKASLAGLEVVMDACMRQAHKRLFQ